MIAVDWGTTHMRAYLLDKDGRIRARRSGPAGVMAVAPDRFASVLEDIVGPWLAEGEGPVVMGGMIGSRQGWIEVPYVRCPASAREIVAGIREVKWGGGRSALICPGLICHDESDVPDVLRGEEIQALGAMPGLPAGAVTLCLPGTHSKHVRLRDGTIERFATYMTGELFSVLRQHSILGRLMEGAAFDSATFDEGIRRAREPGGLPHHLFGVRSRALSGEIQAQAVGSYLSGILIGHEVIAAGPVDRIFVVGVPELCELYMRAFELSGCQATLMDADVAAAGLFRVWQLLAESRAA
jgi:2-dehydro-3-deoxygalactonokinase